VRSLLASKLGLYALDVRGMALAAAIALAAVTGALALAHVLVFTLRVTPTVAHTEARERERLARRRFLGTAAQVGAGVVAVSLLGRVAAAKAPPFFGKCRGKHGPLGIAVAGQPKATPRRALDSLEDEAEVAAVTYCQQFTDCAPSTKCHSSRRPTLKDINPKVTKVGKTYVATGTLDWVNCACT
jgi:hypothetical protein